MPFHVYNRYIPTPYASPSIPYRTDTIRPCRGRPIPVYRSRSDGDVVQV
jgi:hypothetical protein